MSGMASTGTSSTAFHPNAKITGYMQDGLAEMSVDDFAGFVESQTPSPKDQGGQPRLDVLSIEIAGDTAIARVRDDDHLRQLARRSHTQNPERQSSDGMHPGGAAHDTRPALGSPRQALA